VSPVGRGSAFASKYAPSPKEFAELFFRVVDLAEEKGAWIMNSSFANLYTPKDYYCASMKGRAYNFNPDGSISHCYKVQSREEHFANDFIVGYYRADGKYIKIDKAKSVALSSINVSIYPECEECILKNFYSGGCPYRNFVSTGSWNKVNPKMYRMSKLLLKKAIFHIYKQALQGKPSALEGYMQFYKTLVQDNIGDFEANNTLTDTDTNLDFRSRGHLIEFIPIPIVSQNQLVEIDACDICI